MKKTISFVCMLGLMLLLFSACSSSSQGLDEPVQLLNRFKLSLAAGDYETFSTQLALNGEAMTSDEFFALKEDYASMDSSHVSQLLFLFPVDREGVPLIIEYVQTPEEGKPYAISRVISLPEDTAGLLYDALNP